MKYASTILVSLLIIVAVLIPGSKIPDVQVVGFDKLVHLCMFGTWALAWRYDFRIHYRPFVAFSVGFAFSVLTEFLQVFAEGRTFDGWDIMADGIGLALGLLVSRQVLAFLGFLR